MFMKVLLYLVLALSKVFTKANLSFKKQLKEFFNKNSNKTRNSSKARILGFGEKEVIWKATNTDKYKYLSFANNFIVDGSIVLLRVFTEIRILSHS